MLWQTFEDTQAGEDVTLKEGRPVFEYEVLSENSSFPLILYLRKNKVQKDLMQTEFKHVLYNEERTSQYKDAVIKEEKWGWYPSGNLTVKQAEDRVDFIGDAGCWTTPCGWGFGFIVYNYKNYAGKVEKLVKNDTLDQSTLKACIEFNINEKHQIMLDAIASHFLASGTPEQLDKFIEFFNSNDPLMCEKIFTLTINQREIKEVAKKFFEFFDPWELIKIYPIEDWSLIFRELPLFLMDAIGEDFARKDGKPIELKPAFDISNNKAY